MSVELSGTLERLVLALVPGLITAVLAAYITVRLALRRFYAEKWWERKWEAYSAIFQALFDILYSAEIRVRWMEHMRELPEEQDEELRKQSSSGHMTIRRAVAVGSFILSDASVNHLTELRNQLVELGKYDEGLYLYLEGEIDAVNKCIRALEGSAKRDLKGNGPPFSTLAPSFLRPERTIASTRRPTGID